MAELMNIKEASDWATKNIKKKITPSNISYLIQYGKIKNVSSDSITKIDKNDLIKYYQNFIEQRKTDWKKKLGYDLNWALSFDYLKEKDTTKHVHRLHPYKGKFIPQLVEYFLDSHTDNFKRKTYFKSGDIILDPFCGSGTTMVQGNELGMHVVGLDISSFNALIANVKVSNVDFQNLNLELERITFRLRNFIFQKKNYKFEDELINQLNMFNKKYFPSPDYKIKIRQKKIIEKLYSIEKVKIFQIIYNKLIEKYHLNIQQKIQDSFLDKWYLMPVREEIDFVFEQINHIKNLTTKKIITVILSRTIRSCRATTHGDLATLKKPVIQPYYCRKHSKICKPLFTIFSWWRRYSKDTINRLWKFANLKTTTYQICLQGDSRTMNIFTELRKKNENFGNLIRKQKFKGIFSSPPYVGLINYHDQHAYAYDLFGFNRNDQLEIGSLYNGQGRAAREAYVKGIAQVLNNAKRFMQSDYNVFLVANDKYNIYPVIAQKAGMQIINQYKRPVLNRTEKDKGAYAEIIFHLKEKS